MAITLHIDQAGGANFEGYHLRNVATLHVGGAALASGATLEVTGTLKVSGQVNFGAGLNFTGTATILEAGTERGRIAAGVLLWGHTNGGTAAAGEISLNHLKWLHGWSAAGGTVIPLIRTNDTLGVQIGDGNTKIALGAPAAVTGADNGDAILAGDKWLRGVDGASVSRTLIRFNTAYGIQIGTLANDVIGFGVTTAPGANPGELVVAHLKHLRGVDQPGTGTVALIGTNNTGSTTFVQIAAAGTQAVLLGNVPVAAAAAAAGGEVVLANGKWLRGANTAATSPLQMIGLVNPGAGDIIQIGASFQTPVALGQNITTNAAGGELVLGNTKALRGVNAGGTDTVVIGYIDTDGQTQLGASTWGAKIGRLVAGSLPAASASLNGLLILDTTNNVLCYYIGGSRFRLTGTAF